MPSTPERRRQLRRTTPQPRDPAQRAEHAARERARRAARKALGLPSETPRTRGPGLAPGCRAYRHPEQPAPVPVRFAPTGRWREMWED